MEVVETRRFLIVSLGDLRGNLQARKDVTMKRFALSILLLLVATTAFGQDSLTRNTFTSRYGGGYNIYGSNGRSGYTTPRFGGGVNYYGSDGSSGYSTPRYGGGYNYYGNRGTSGYSTPRYGGGSNYYGSGWNFYGR